MEETLERLRQSEARLNEAQRIAKLGSWELDITTGKLTWSDEIFRMFEIDKAVFAASYEAFLGAVHPEDREAVDAAYTASLASRQPYEITHRLRMADGQIKWVHERGETSYDAAGTPLRSIGTVQDVTERVLAQQTLAAHEAAYRRLHERARLQDDTIAASLNAVAFATLEGNLAYANRSFLALWGYEHEWDVVGRPVLDFWADREDRTRVLRTVIETGGGTGESLALRKDGTTFIAMWSITVLHDDAGQPVHLLGCFLDVTQRRHAESRLALVFNSSSDRQLLVRAERDGRFVVELANEALCKLASSALQAPLDTLVGRDCSQLGEQLGLSPQAVAAGLARYQQVLDCGVAETHELTLALRSGTADLEIALQPVSDPSGARTHVLAVIRDITERKRAAQELSRAYDLQRRALEENDILLREIHHRVKNNLQIISSLLHFHMKKAHLPQERSVLEEVRKRLFAMILVHEKLFRSKHLATVELGDYARSLTGTLVQSFEGRGRIGFEVVSHDVYLPIEFALPAGMILCELVTNVFKYAFPSGRAGHARVNVQKDGDRVLMGVDDDGVGLPDGFDPKTAQSFGFYLVRSLVSQLDGELTAHSSRGAHLHVSFPVRQSIAK